MRPATTTAIASAAISAVAFMTFVLGAHVQSDLAIEMQVSVATFASWNSLSFVMAIVGGFAIGSLARYLGHRVALSVVFLLCLMASLGLAHATTPDTVLWARLLAAAAFGGTWGTAHAAVLALAGPTERPYLASIVQTGPPWGAGLAAALTSFIGPYLGTHSHLSPWRLSAASAAALVLLSSPLLLRIPHRSSRPTSHPTPPRSADPKTPHESLVSDDAVPSSPLTTAHNGESPNSNSTADQGDTTPNVTQGIARLLPSVLLLALHMAAYWCSFAWLPQHLIQDRGVSRQDAGLMLVGLSITQILGDLVFGRLATRIGLRRALALGSFAVAVGLASLAAAWSFLATSPWALAGCLATIGLGMGLWSTFAPLFASQFEITTRASGLSSLYNVARVIQIPAQLAVASLYSATGSLAAALLLSAGCSLAAIPLLPYLSRRTDHRTP